MTRPSLAGIEQRTAAATAGPWFQGRNGRPHESTCDVYSKREPHEPDSHDIATYVHSEEDAAFITDARTAVPALTDAVRDVLALHAPVQYGTSPLLVCQHCRTGQGNRVAHPCPTVRALAGDPDPQPCGRVPCAALDGHAGT